MRAFLLTEAGCHLADVPDPVPGPGQVVVQVRAAGLCHSDLTLAGRAADAHPFSLPIVLGHELAGTVVATTVGVTGVHVGDPVVGYGPRGCGTCVACSRGAENYCPRPPVDSFAPGLGSDGALAEYVAVDASHLLAAPEVDPVQAAALSDTGLTAFHALGRALAGWSSSSLPTALSTATVVVIGVGGLGHAAVQFARIAGVRVIAIDTVQGKLDLAEEVGADRVFAAGAEVVDEVREATAGRGAEVVLDFVATNQTLAQGAAMLAVNGVLSVVGVGDGRLPVGMHAMPLGSRTDLPFWGTRSDLREVLQLAEAGRVRIHVEEVPLERVADAYERLAHGSVIGRAVALPLTTGIN